MNSLTKNQRELFSVPKGLYFLNHSVGCLPLSTREVLDKNFFTAWEQQGGNAWELWLQQIQGFKQVLASLLNAEADEFSIIARR